MPDATQPLAKRLIVNADDLGLSPGVNRGILEAHQRGVVTSTTAMMNMPAVVAGIALAQAAPGLGLGLHFNLSYGKPLIHSAKVPSLVRGDGQFVSVSRGLASSRRWQLDEVRAELSAQFERFVTLAGTLPDHLDSHQMVGSLSAVCREVMLDLAEAHDLPMRQGGRAAFQTLEREVARHNAVAKALAPTLFKGWPWRRFDPIYDRSVLEPDHFEVRFLGRGATVETLLRILDELSEGVTELVCHPGYIDAEADAYRGRETELAALTDPRVLERVELLGLELITFEALS